MSKESSQKEVYIMVKKATKVNASKVTIKDIATVVSSDQNALKRIKSLSLYTFKTEKKKRVDRCVISAMKAVDEIIKVYPDISVTPIGEAECVVEYDMTKKMTKTLEYIKTAAICIILFLGAGFAIMAFNNDISIHKLFGHLYKQFTGQESSGYTVLEFGYSVGIFIGITVFYNHFTKIKMSTDPTPVEIEMRKYEDDINTTYADGIRRKDANIDA